MIKLKELISKNKLIIAALIFAAFVSIVTKGEKPQANEQLPKEPVEATTLIPNGFVLVPIEVSNHEALDSILGSYGVVDLYSKSENPNDKPKRVASQVKIIRAPNNQNQFAVLIPEVESSHFVNATGSYLVVIQNPKKNDTSITSNKKSKSRIQYED